MTSDLLTFLVLAPGWMTGVLLLVMGSRSRSLARPLWNSDRVDGIVVAHEQWLVANGRERTGLVIDFDEGSGRSARLFEPPVRWERPPAVGSRVRISFRPNDPAFAKRFSRRRQLVAWLATLLSLPIVVLFLVAYPVFMAVVLVPHVVWVVCRRLRPPAAPVRVPTDLSAVGAGGFDPRAMVVPDAPPTMEPTPDRPGELGPVVPAPFRELAHRHFYPLVSGVVVLIVALIGASRSNHELALLWHVTLVVVLGAGIVLFETSLAYRGGSVVTGRVVDHLHRRDTEGDVYWLEIVEFESERETTRFVDTAGRRRQRPIGSKVTVSYRSGEPERARSLHRSQSLLGTALIAGAVGVGVFLSAPTWVPVLIQTAVCYLGYIVLDIVRGVTTATPALEAN